MDDSLRLRIASIFVLFGASFLGIMIPLVGFHSKQYKALIPMLQTGSAGIMLGLALIHLCPDANETLGELVPDYPVGYVLTGVGIMIVMCIEQTVLYYADTKQRRPVSLTLALNPSDGNVHNENCGFVSCDHDDAERGEKYTGATSYQQAGSTILAHDHDHDHDHGHDHGHSGPCSSSCGPQLNQRSASVATAKVSSIADNHSDHDDHIDHDLVAIQDLAQAESMQDLILAYALELSTAVHSIIIGVNLGILGSDDYNTVSILLVALCFHQFVEGMGVGQVLEGNAKSLGTAKLVIFVVIFSCTISLGVLIGILTSAEDESTSGEAAKSVATALASGSLLYTSLVEMAGHYFASPKLHKEPAKRLYMLLSFMIGFGFMALVGVWA